MTLKVNLEEVRARVAGRRQQKADRDAALRERGVAVMPESTRTVLTSTKNVLGRILPWRRGADGS